MTSFSEDGEMDAQSPSDPARRARFLHEIGVGPLWTLRARDGHQGAAHDEPALAAAAVALPASGSGRPPASNEVAAARPEPAEIALMDWPALQRAASTCTACSLSRTRTQVVFGDGDDHAQWLIVSSAATRDDDTTGVPLAGQRGKLIDNMLRAAGRNRIAGTYLTPAVKCRAVDSAGHDRAPSAQEAAACRPFLERQIALLAPTVIVALGAGNPIGGAALARGQVQRLGTAALVAMDDPETLLHNPAAKAQAWADLCLAKASDAQPD